MLTTLTCLSGMYAGTGMGLQIMNNFLIEHNMIKTLRGKKFLVKPEIIKPGYMYKIYKENIAFDDDGEIRLQHYCIKEDYTFTIQNEPLHFTDTEFFGELLKCEMFDNLNKKKLNTDDKKLFELCKSKNGTKIEYSNPIKTGDVWYLADKNNNCSILAITNKKDFREMVMKKYEFPFLMTSFIIFNICSLLCFIRWLDGGDEKECNCHRC